MINHPAPELSVDFTPFKNAGCDKEGGRCDLDTPLGELGCDWVEPVGDYLGGLVPALPMAACWENGAKPGPAPEGIIYVSGCLHWQYLRYVVERDGKFQLIRTESEMQDVFGTIDSQTEALSYALALSGYAAYYGMTATAGMRYSTELLEDTHVEPVPEGYRVHLFDYQLCGCGPHPTYAVTILVTLEGRIKELDRKLLFEDPTQDKLCVY